jgi:hypothetical protein
LIPGKKVTPTPAPPKDKHIDKKKSIHGWINIDVVPPPPSLLGPPAFLGEPPPYHAIRQSEPVYLDEGVVSVPDNYVAPPQNNPVQVSRTALRAWNGQETAPGRAFDQTRVQVQIAADNTLPWQFYWKIHGGKTPAARWEVATVPFVAGFSTFPPAGLVAYGDAAINAESPLSENFFGLDFASFSKNFDEGSRPKKYYMRVVLIDQNGNPAGSASNLVRVDLP